jgi:hypothetical protein
MLIGLSECSSERIGRMGTRTEVKSEGPAEVSDEGVEIFSYHLSRFVADWVEMAPVEQLWTTLGFEGSAVASETFRLTADQTVSDAVPWTFEDLRHACRAGDGRIHVESGWREEAPARLEVVPLLDRPATGGRQSVVFGFVVYRAGEVSHAGMESVGDRAANAIRAARRNAVRMFFEENEARPVKPFLYELMDRLPEWTGCDHSASMIMTSTVETMALQASGHGRLDVLAERLYGADGRDDQQRLVGMSLLLEDDDSHLLRAAVRRQIEDPALPYQIYTRRDGRWEAEQGGESGLPNFHGLEGRDAEARYIMVPLMGHPDQQTELLGFLCLAYRQDADIPSSIGELLASLGRRLSERLRYSPLYTLNASKLWVLRRLRERAAQAVQQTTAPPNERLESLIEDLSTLLPHHVDVPSFAVGVLNEDNSGDRQLSYVHPHGWTRFDDLSLPVDLPAGDRTDSGVSALAVRLNRPLILAGGHGSGSGQRFKNFVYVDEESGQLLDARAPDASASLSASDTDWQQLSDYYKPARKSAYATLAYPISMGEEVLGVLTVEVDEQTQWVWWTGFGGQIFWEMVADQLAWPIYELN